MWNGSLSSLFGPRGGKHNKNNKSQFCFGTHGNGLWCVSIHS